jgi:MerR family redox-sensitive transcriptional activator SoxR
MTPETLTIGEVARRVDLNPSAIRYYERIGLMPPATRVSGQRRYGLDTVHRLGLLKAAKRLGFTLEETQLLLAAEAEGEPADRMRALAEQKLSEVDSLIEQLMEVRRLLLGATQCRADHLCDCTVLAEPTARRVGGSLRHGQGDEVVVVRDTGDGLRVGRVEGDIGHPP